MKMYLVSDNIDTLVGMRLAGVDGVIVHEYEEIVDAINSAIDMEDVGILLLTEKVEAKAADYVRNLMLTVKSPLITTIPDRHAKKDIAASINSLVSESIGLKL